MRNFKKLFFVFLMVLAMVFVVACGEKEDEKTPTPDQPVEPTPEDPTQPVEPTPEQPDPVEPEDIILVVNGVEYEGGATIEIEALSEIKLEFKYLPADKPVLEGVDISSSNESVLTVDADGNMKALEVGMAYIELASLWAEVYKTYYVNVTPKYYAPESIAIDAKWTEIEVGEKFVLTAAVTPAEASQEVKWSSSNESVIVIDEKTGALEAVAQGEAKLIATSAEKEEVKAEVTIKVGAAREVDTTKVLMIPVMEERTYEYEGVTYYKDRNLFSNVTDAVKAVAAGGTIVFLAGEYEVLEPTTVDKTITFVGPNADKLVSEEREPEANVNVQSGTHTPFIIEAENVVFNGLGLGVTSGIQGVLFEINDNAKNISVKSCHLYKLNTIIRTYNDGGTKLLGKWEVSNCHITELVQFIAWVKDVDDVSQFEGIDVLNNKIYQGTGNVAVNGIISVRTTKEHVYVNFKYNEIDFTDYSWASFVAWVKGGMFNVRYNVFKNMNVALFGNVMTSNVNVSNNIFLDAEGNVVAEPDLGVGIVGKDNYESLDAYYEGLKNPIVDVLPELPEPSEPEPDDPEQPEQPEKPKNEFDKFAEEMVALFNSPEETDKSETTQAGFQGSSHPNIKYVFDDAETLAKYKWFFEFALSEYTRALNEGIFTETDQNNCYKELKAMLEGMIAGDTTAVSGSYPEGRSCFRQFIHEVINANDSANVGHTTYDTFVYDYDTDLEARARFLAAYAANNYTDDDYLQAFADEMVALFNSPEESDKKETTQNEFQGTTHPNVKYVFDDAETLAKYKWLLEYILAEYTAACQANGLTTLASGAPIESMNTMLEAMIAGDTAAISGADYADARSCLRQFIHLLINAKNPSHNGGTAAYNPYCVDYAANAEKLAGFIELYKANK